VRNRARSLAIGIALAPLALFGLVAVYTHGTVQIVCASLAVGLFALAVVVIYLLERPRSQQSRRASSAPATELVVDLDLGVRWDRDRPDAWLVQRDGGALLILKPEGRDQDRRLVVLVWTPCTAARVGPAAAPTGDDRWVAEVKPSNWIVDLGGDPLGNDLRHFVVSTNEETIEVVAAGVVVHRVDRIRLAADSAADEAPS
jgi:hypothetical protein